MNSQPKKVRKIERNIKPPANGVEKRVNEDMFEMERLEAMFNDVPADGVVPDGFYEVAIEKTVKGETQAGNPKLAWWLRITDGPYEGQMLFKNSVFSTPYSVVYFKRDLALCNYYPTSLEEALSNPSELQGVQLVVEKVTRDGFTSIYLKEYLGRVGEDDGCYEEAPF
jgi:hypothetical protein